MVFPVHVDEKNVQKAERGLGQPLLSIYDSRQLVYQLGRKARGCVGAQDELPHDIEDIIHILVVRIQE